MAPAKGQRVVWLIYHKNSSSLSNEALNSL